MKILRIALAALIALAPITAQAASGTVTGKNAVGTTVTFDVTVDGSGNLVPWQVICDQAAAAQCASVTASNALKVDGSAVTQPVSGTVTANAGTGTFAISAASLPLPAGAATQTTLASILTALGSPLQAGGTVTANLGTLNGAATAVLQGTNSNTTVHTCSVTGYSILGCLGQIDDDVKGAITAGTATIGNVGTITPAGATAITASAIGTTAATTATLAGTAGKTTYVCWLSIRANATSAATGNATVTGTITGTLNFTQWTAPNASGLGVTEMVFNPCTPASATNTGIAVVSAAPGTGGVVSVSAGGYQM